MASVASFMSESKPYRFRPPDVTTVALFKSAMSGTSYGELAQRHKLSKNAVSRRVKRLAVSLCRIGEVPGLNEFTLSSLKAMQRHGAALLDALSRAQDLPTLGGETKVLGEDERWRAAARLRTHSPTAKRDEAMLHTVLCTGAWPLEIARLQVRDVLRKNGAVRLDCFIRAEVAVNAKERTVPLEDAQLVDALNAYLLERTHSTIAPPCVRHEYRGLDPLSPLFLEHGRCGFAVVETLDAKGQTRHLCRAILDHYRRIFRRAGLPWASATVARRSAAYLMAKQGADARQIGQAMGVVGLAAVKHLLGRAVCETSFNP